MSTRKRLRELIARGRLVPMPGAYDALSAKIMEAEGFDAIIAGGYAAIGSMMGQADMGQCNVRDYADHYARICDAVNLEGDVLGKYIERQLEARGAVSESQRSLTLARLREEGF